MAPARTSAGQTTSTEDAEGELLQTVSADDEQVRSLGTLEQDVVRVSHRDEVEDYARKAVHQAVINLDARPAPAGPMTVVLGPEWGDDSRRVRRHRLSKAIRAANFI